MEIPFFTETLKHRDRERQTVQDTISNYAWIKLRKELIVLLNKNVVTSKYKYMYLHMCICAQQIDMHICNSCIIIHFIVIVQVCHWHTWFTLTTETARAAQDGYHVHQAATCLKLPIFLLTCCCILSSVKCMILYEIWCCMFLKVLQCSQMLNEFWKLKAQTATGRAKELVLWVWRLKQTQWIDREVIT